MLLAFLNKEYLVENFITKCLPRGYSHDLFKSRPRIHVDWRWEFLSIALDTLVPLYLILKEFYDVATMGMNEAGKLVDSSLLRDVAEALKNKTSYHARSCIVCLARSWKLVRRGLKSVIAIRNFGSNMA